MEKSTFLGRGGALWHGSRTNDACQDSRMIILILTLFRTGAMVRPVSQQSSRSELPSPRHAACLHLTPYQSWPTVALTSYHIISRYLLVLVLQVPLRSSPPVVFPTRARRTEFQWCHRLFFNFGLGDVSDHGRDFSVCQSTEEAEKLNTNDESDSYYYSWAARWDGGLHPWAADP